MNNVITHGLFGGLVRVAITTQDFGSVHPKREDFEGQLGQLMNLTGSQQILFPRLQFGRGVVQGEGLKGDVIETFPGHDDQPIPGFLRSPFHSDAGISAKLPIGICNADSPVGIMLTTPDTSGQRHLVVMHLGLMCMISKTGEQSIIERVIESLRLQKMQIEGFWMGLGARACCYGLGPNDDRWALVRKWQFENKPVRKGPRQGQDAVDLGLMARMQLIRLGIHRGKINIDPHCTCCNGGMPTESPYFSNLLGCGAQDRNAVVVWLT